MKTRKILQVILAISLILSALSTLGGITASAASVWDGSKMNVLWYAKDPSAATFTITTAEEFAGFAYLVNHRDANTKYREDGTVAEDGTKTTKGSAFAGKTIKLAGDVDLASKPFAPIGATGSFQGTFDGSGFTVKNYYVTTDSSKNEVNAGQYYFALFGTVGVGAVIKNLKIENIVYDVNVLKSATRIDVGSVAAYIHPNKGGSCIDITVKRMTVNITKEEGATYKPRVGPIYGCYDTKVGTTKNISVTDYQVNAAAGVEVQTYEGGLVGITNANSNTASWENVTFSVKQEGSGSESVPGSEPGSQPGSETTPPTSDGFFVLPIVALLCAAGIVLVIRSRRTA